MHKRILTRAGLLLAVGGATIAASAVPAQANPVPDAPHPAPLCGALNMAESSPSFYPYAVSDGMDIAMNTIYVVGQGINGWNNMFLAVANSSQASSPSCS
jgi:hypothetical protein